VWIKAECAQITILAATCLLANKSHVRAQSTACPPRSAVASHDKKPSGPRIEIVDVVFTGSLQLPISDQDQIADSIKQQDYGDSLDGLIDDAVERVKAGWQDRGYFKVQVSGEEATLTSMSANRPITLTFHVDEGVQYRLNEITFENNKVISDVAARGLFQINDGDIFSREKIASGLSSLITAYVDLGYVNFTAVPNTNFEDEKKLISVDIDLDEGKRFFVTNVDILGLDEPARQELLKELPIKRGQVWASTSGPSLRKYDSMLPHCDCREAVRMDQRTGTVTVTLDFRPCPTN
jgi:outer membrane protein assembly factor BamA